MEFSGVKKTGDTVSGPVSDLQDNGNGQLVSDRPLQDLKRPGRLAVPLPPEQQESAHTQQGQAGGFRDEAGIYREIV